MKRGLPLLMIAAALLTQGHSTSASAPFEVGVVYWSMNIPGQVAMRRGLEAEAKQINRENPTRPVRLLPHVGGEGDAGVARQRAAMRELIARKPDAIIVQPIDSAALSKPVQEANAAGIPVVAYDQYVLKGKLACYLTSDNALAGRLDGEYLAHRFRDRTPAHPLRLVIVEYPYVSSTVDRVDGLLTALTDSRVPFEIVARYEAVEPASGREAGRRIAERHPKGSIDAVFCVNDGGGSGVLAALKQAKRQDLVLATIDGDPAMVAEIRRGGMVGIDTAQFCGPLGAESMRWTYRLLRGEKVPRQVLVTVFPITRESVGAYPGWLGPIPETIRAPWPPHQPVPGNRLTW
ncbi:MAG: sugar ABC transporter substrate-binding protein [Candidatus Sericytochromatia bacterium]